MYFRGQVVLVVAVFVALTQPGESRRFSRCELARELRRQGFPMHQLPDWVCLIESESSRDTAAIGRLNDDGSEDHGLFQISDKFWCGRGYTGKGCNVNCDGESTLLTDLCVTGHWQPGLNHS
uniref:lysozyme n=1 Tax=Timema poppense TaxID=170557 RepID=A0A7R9HB75_TIMPO|nr:unnamed protein product [Timema poppensis]